MKRERWTLLAVGRGGMLRHSFLLRMHGIIPLRKVNWLASKKIRSDGIA